MFIKRRRRKKKKKKTSGLISYIRDSNALTFMEIVTERSRSDSRWTFKMNYSYFLRKFPKNFYKNNLSSQRSFQILNQMFEIFERNFFLLFNFDNRDEISERRYVLCSFPLLEGMYTDEYQFCRPSTVSWPMRQSRSTNILRTIAPTKILRALSNALDENVKARWSYVDNLI